MRRVPRRTGSQSGHLRGCSPPAPQGCGRKASLLFLPAGRGSWGPGAGRRPRCTLRAVIWCQLSLAEGGKGKVEGEGHGGAMASDRSGSAWGECRNLPEPLPSAMCSSHLIKMSSKNSALSPARRRGGQVMDAPRCNDTAFG